MDEGCGGRAARRPEPEHGDARRARSGAGERSERVAHLRRLRRLEGSGCPGTVPRPDDPERPRPRTSRCHRGEGLRVARERTRRVGRRRGAGRSAQGLAHGADEEPARVAGRGLAVETTNERSNAMTYRENAKPKPMTQSDLVAEIDRMQVEWDEAYADFKKKVDPLELRKVRLFKAAEEVAEEAGEEFSLDDRLGHHTWTCDKCDEEENGSATLPPLAST